MSERRERSKKRIAMLTVQTCLHQCMLLRALGAQPRRRKPAFVTHDNEASLCDVFTSDFSFISDLKI